MFDSIIDSIIMEDGMLVKYSESPGEHDGRRGQVFDARSCSFGR